MADRPDIDRLAEDVRKRELARNTRTVGPEKDWRGHYIITEAELAELVALARENEAWVTIDHYEDLLADRDRLAEALGSILTAIEDANQAYERLYIGSLARAALSAADREKQP